MNLHLCINGAIEDTFPLIDANDLFNAAAERTALDRAYEAKTACDDDVVTILVDFDEDDEDDEEITDGDLNAAAHALNLLADLDDGEGNVDGDELRRLATKFLKKTDAVVPDDEPTTPRSELELVREIARASLPHELDEGTDYWFNLFIRLSEGDASAVNEAIALLRTHAVDDQHPLACD